MDEKNFWEDLEASISTLVSRTLYGYSIAKAADHLGVSESLIYKWVNEKEPQIPNLKQFLKILQFTRNYEAIKVIAGASGYVSVKRNGSVPQMVAEFAEELKKTEVVPERR